jgi:hypothetical protein
MLLVLGCGAGVLNAASYSWQDPQATITPSGDLEWAPEPFVFEAGASVRYIDYEGGSDSNTGLSKDSPWKHHPWDANATGNAAAESGIHTYVFKRGVAYRGTLNVTESGAKNNPIRLTSDPSWGSGEAMLYGSEVVSNWTQGAQASMPSQDKVWYATVSYRPRRVWLVEGTNITHIPLARTPNWVESNPDDVKSQWWTWTATSTLSGNTRKNRDTLHLNQSADYYVGALLWTEYAVVMATPYPVTVTAYDAGQHALTFTHPYTQWQHHRYFLENKPQYLDSAGEFWYDDSTHRVYIRLPGDVDPNGKQVEVAARLQQLRGNNVSHLHVSGLAFRFQNRHWIMTQRTFGDPDMDNASVGLFGYGDDIVVKNCKFEYVSKAARIETEKFADSLDNVVFSDNQLVENYHGAINIVDTSGDGVYPGRSGELGDVKILRNKLYRCGTRPMHYSHGHAMQMSYAETAEVAGNILNRMYGSGIFIFGGRSGGEGGDRPLARVLIHHNRVEDSLLSANDWGGIETWQGGAFYLFSNISANPGGYWHPQWVWNKRARLGFAYYLDGSFKNYVFNNVAWGKSSDPNSPLCNRSALQFAAGGFQNMMMNNTVFRFQVGVTGGGMMTGRNTWGGNLWMDLDEDYHIVSCGSISDSKYDYENLAFTHEMFYQKPDSYGRFEVPGTTRSSLGAYQSALVNRKTRCGDFGQETGTAPVQDANNHNFVPGAGSPAVDGGVKFFAPWALYDTLAEWNFMVNRKTPGKVTDDHWNMKSYYGGRTDYYKTKRNHLVVSGVTTNDYMFGPLEDWCPGALVFDGSRDGTVVPEGDGNIGLDVKTNNFVIEVVFKTAPGHVNGALVSKVDIKGYIVDIDGQGRARLRLWNNSVDTFVRTTSVMVNDGAWHHLLVDVDRSHPQGARLYVDGVRADMPPSGFVPGPSEDLTASADLKVGSAIGGFYFNGAIDFMRIAAGDLEDAKTTIDELYEWEFNGPQLYDFRGVLSGGKHDVGAYDAGAAQPVIMRQPQDTTIELDWDAGLRVAAGNVTAYQWYKDGQAVNGATGTVLALPDATWGDQGDYFVVVGDGSTQVTSAWANVTVVPEPVGGLAALAMAIAAAIRTRRVLS